MKTAFLIGAAVVTVVFGILLFPVTPAYATDNFTATDNVTLDFYNPDDLEIALTNALVTYNLAFEATVNQTIASMEELIDTIEENQEDTLGGILSFVFCVILTTAAFWLQKRDAGSGKRSDGEPFIDIMAVIFDIAYGTMYASSQIIRSPEWFMGLLIAIIGTWLLIRRIRIEFIRAREKRRNNDQ